MNKRAHYEKFDESLKLQVDIHLEADFSIEYITGYFKRNHMVRISHKKYLPLCLERQKTWV